MVHYYHFEHMDRSSGSSREFHGGALPGLSENATNIDGEHDG